MLAELAVVAERDPQAIPHIRKLIVVLSEARGLETSPEPIADALH